MLRYSPRKQSVCPTALVTGNGYMRSYMYVPSLRLRCDEGMYAHKCILLEENRTSSNGNPSSQDFAMAIYGINAIRKYYWTLLQWRHVCLRIDIDDYTLYNIVDIVLLLDLR